MGGWLGERMIVCFFFVSVGNNISAKTENDDKTRGVIPGLSVESILSKN